MAAAKAQTRASFGNVRELPSGKFQARWRSAGRYYSARKPDGSPLTFATEVKAREWLIRNAPAIQEGTWSATPPPPPPEVVTFGEFAAVVIENRRGKGGARLAETTRQHYRQLLRDYLAPTFGAKPLDAITPADVRLWHASLPAGAPTAQAHAYSLLREVFGVAVADDIVTTNPCRVRGAGQSPARKKMRPASLAELTALADAMPERLRMIVTLTAWCSLRFGEVTELRRGDVDLSGAVVHVGRGVTRVTGRVIVKEPKSAAGVRKVSIPPHILDDLRHHLDTYVDPGSGALLFPAADGESNLGYSTLMRHFYRARDAAGRPDFNFHGLRHTGQTLAALSGANLRELMNRAGQSTPAAALGYLHEVETRQATIAAAMSALTTTPATPAT